MNIRKKDILGFNDYIAKIIDKYEVLDEAHGKDHILDVIQNTKNIVGALNNPCINLSLCIAAAAYHDIGMIEHGRKDHNIHSANYVMGDENLKNYFSDLEIKIIADACWEHRASYDGQYSSIYSKILSDADRDGTDVDKMIRRAYLYNKHNYPQDNDAEIYRKVHSHLKDKYGYNGYAKYNLDVSTKLLDETRDIIEDEKLFRSHYIKVVGEE